MRLFHEPPLFDDPGDSPLHRFVATADKNAVTAWTHSDQPPSVIFFQNPQPVSSSRGITNSRVAQVVAAAFVIVSFGIRGASHCQSR